MNQHLVDTSPFIVSAILTGICTLIFIFYCNPFSLKDGKKKYMEPPFTKHGYIATMKGLLAKNMPDYILQWARESGQTFRLRIPFSRYPMVVVTGDLHLCREILNDRSSLKSPGGLKSFKVHVVKEYCDDIITSEGAYHKHSRKHISPAFATKHIKRMLATATEKTNELVNTLDNVAEKGESFDVGTAMIHVTIQVVCEAAFGYPITFEERNLLADDVGAMLKEGKKGVIPFRWKFGAFNKEFLKARDSSLRVYGFASKVLEHHRRQESPQEGNVVDLIDKNPNYTNDNERRNDLVVLFIAGYDTTAYTLAWTLLQLAKNKEEQTKLRNELRSMPVEDRQNSAGLQCVIKEGMRLKPVLPLGSSRIVSRDVILRKTEENGLERDMLIPKGSCVRCCLLLLNHNPNYHDDAEVFRPSRWIEPSRNALASLLTFSLGRRSCIGQSLAKAEIVGVLARLCVDYEFSVADEGDQNVMMVHQPVGARLFVKKIDNQL